MPRLFCVEKNETGRSPVSGTGDAPAIGARVYGARRLGFVKANGFQPLYATASLAASGGGGEGIG